MAEVSIAEVDQAEAALAEAKAAYADNPDTKAEFLEAKRQVVAVRQAYRQQEEAAGRRGRVGGDAFVATPEED